MNDYNRRTARFAKTLAEKSISIAVFFNERHFDYDIAYFTGISIKNSFLIITKKGNSYFFTSEMEYEKAKKLLPKNIKPKKLSSLADLSSFISRLRPKTIGLSYNISHKLFKKIKSSIKSKSKKAKITDISDLALEQRSVKTEEEIKIIRKSYQIASKILQKAILGIKNNKLRSEHEIYNFLVKETEKNNCLLAFQPIVASGKNTSIPHYLTPSKKLNKGFLMIDFGVKYKNYCSDITRTIYLGKITKKQEAMYNLLLSVQEDAIKQLKEGISFAYLDKKVRKKLGKYSKNFTHGLGHGLGLYIHELPSLHSKTKDRLKNNMVFTIEPGIYFPGKFGIRIEDGILFLNNKAEILTKISKKLIVFDTTTKKGKR